MDEDTVVAAKEQLTNEMIEAGAQLTQKLDEMGVPMQLAMWFYDSEINEWRLYYYSPRAMTEGSEDVYKQIQVARKALGAQAEHVPFMAIRLMVTNRDLAEAITKRFKTGPGLSRIRLKKHGLNGRFIDDVLIYRSAA